MLAGHASFRCTGTTRDAADPGMFSGFEKISRFASGCSAGRLDALPTQPNQACERSSNVVVLSYSDASIDVVGDGGCALAGSSSSRS
jgi:hypothetical protein